jgi:hypothetical protein
MRCGSIFLLFSLVVFGEVATASESGTHCFESCELTLAYVRFNDTDPRLSRKKAECTSELRAKSLYLCFEEYCTDGERGKWLQPRGERCLRLSNTTLPPYDIINDYSPEDVARLKRLYTGETSWDSIPLLIDQVVIPDAHFFATAFKTLVRHSFNVSFAIFTSRNRTMLISRAPCTGHTGKLTSPST